MRKIKPKTDSYMIGSTAGLKKEKAKPIFPSIRIDLEHIPESKNWKIGETYEVDMKLKMIGISQSRYDNSAEFEIREIEPEGDKAGDDGDNENDDE